jgi:hypothetical protein
MKAGTKAESRHAGEHNGLALLDEALPQTTVGSSHNQDGRHSNERIQLQTLVIHLPLYHNRDHNGHREPVAPPLLNETVAEIRRRYSGYTSYRVTGWYRDVETGREYPDEIIRFEIDALFDEDERVFLNGWKHQLEVRFEQRAIYMKISGPVEWI